MTLWNLIRDFFVQNIFGGWLSNNTKVNPNFVGYIRAENSSATAGYSADTYVHVGDILNSNGSVVSYITLGDWLSTTFTIITLVLLVFFLYIFVKWIFKLFAGLMYR